MARPGEGVLVLWGGWSDRLVWKDRQTGREVQTPASYTLGAEMLDWIWEVRERKAGVPAHVGPET